MIFLWIDWDKNMFLAFKEIVKKYFKISNENVLLLKK
jgi:hypothetical protein